MDEGLQRGLTPLPFTVPTRAAGWQRLEEFLPAVPRYAKVRGYDLPGQQGTSGLGPYLRARLLREREVIATVLQRHGHAKAAKFIEEVCWRTYWKGHLEQRPAIWEQYRRRRDAWLGELTLADRERLAAAREGSTGIACFDAWVNELTVTGRLHNHARMWFASIWIFTLRLPWELGAAFFLEHLLDGDPASNTLGWRWVAGLHTPGKHYLARADNIRRYTDGRFNPVGQLLETANPLPPDGPHPLVALEPVAALADIDFPNLSTCPAGLLVCPEDLSPETGELADTPFSSIAVFNARDVLAADGVSATVRAFTDNAVADTAERVAAHWDGRITHCERAVIPAVGKATPDHVGRRERMRVYSGTLDRWEEGVLTWAANEHLKSVWMFLPPVGPWRDRVPVLRQALQARGVSLLAYRRRWDALHWPHATRGFFAFKRDLAERLEQGQA